MNLAEKQQRLIDDLLLIENAQERFAALVDSARSRPPLPPGERNEATRVKGCISAAWVVAELRGGRCYFRGDAESPLVRGLVVMVCDFYSGGEPADIVASEPGFIAALGLDRTLSPTRLNGVRSVRARIREFAEEHVGRTPSA